MLHSTTRADSSSAGESGTSGADTALCSLYVKYLYFVMFDEILLCAIGIFLCCLIFLVFFVLGFYEWVL